MSAQDYQLVILRSYEPNHTPSAWQPWFVLGDALVLHWKQAIDQDRTRMLTSRLTLRPQANTAENIHLSHRLYTNSRTECRVSNRNTKESSTASWATWRTRYRNWTGSSKPLSAKHKQRQSLKLQYAVFIGSVAVLYCKVDSTEHGDPECKWINVLSWMKLCNVAYRTTKIPHNHQCTCWDSKLHYGVTTTATATTDIKYFQTNKEL